MSSKREALDLTTCPITSGLLRFSLPFLASSILQTLYSTVDTIIVGQFVGSAGLAAVNNVSFICNAASNIGLGASAGSAVLIAQYCGAKNEEAIQESLYLNGFPGLAESIIEGMKTPVSECSTELKW